MRGREAGACGAGGGGGGCAPQGCGVIWWGVFGVEGSSQCCGVYDVCMRACMCTMWWGAFEWGPQQSVLKKVLEEAGALPWVVAVALLLLPLRCCRRFAAAAFDLCKVAAQRSVGGPAASFLWQASCSACSVVSPRWRLKHTVVLFAQGRRHRWAGVCTRGASHRAWGPWPLCQALPSAEG